MRDGDGKSRVSAARGNWKNRNGVLCDRNMPVKEKGEHIQESCNASIAVLFRDMVDDEQPIKETGGE